MGPVNGRKRRESGRRHYGQDTPFADIAVLEEAALDRHKSGAHCDRLNKEQNAGCGRRAATFSCPKPAAYCRQAKSLHITPTLRVEDVGSAMPVGREGE